MLYSFNLRLSLDFIKPVFLNIVYQRQSRDVCIYFEVEMVSFAILPDFYSGLIIKIEEMRLILYEYQDPTC